MYFLLYMRVCVGLIMLAAFHVSLLLICQQGLRQFVKYRPLPPIGWRIMQTVRQRRRENDQYSDVKYKQQANPLLSMHNCTPLVIRGNGNNKLLRQTRIKWKKNVNGSLNLDGHLNKIKTNCDAY
jgi:hypothetical protein